MSLKGRITELSNKHQKLENEIREELKRAAADQLRLATLKKQKLRIKEELTHLGAT